MQKEAPSTNPNPQTVKRKRRFVRDHPADCPDVSGGFCMWIQMSGRFSCCAALTINICWESHWGHCCFSFFSWSSPCHSLVCRFLLAHSGAGQTQPMDTQISSASLTFPGFPLLCYHREIPFLAVLTENLSLDQVTWPAKLLLLILNNISGELCVWQD